MSTRSKRRYQVVLRWEDRGSWRDMTKTVTVWADSAHDAARQARHQVNQLDVETTVNPL